jgi:hypothetical protein
MSHFATITTNSHFFKVFALAESLKSFAITLHVLVVDGDTFPNEYPSNIVFYKLNDITNPLEKQLEKKYKGDRLRWSLKPVFLINLLAKHEKVVYVDNDIFFYANPHFIFEYLTHHSLIVTPHFYPDSPFRNQNWLEANFRVGLFNAGFIGVNRNAIDFLTWWANCCLFTVKKAYWRGLFDDQKYLDLAPIKVPDMKIMQHRGCNLAGWNDTDLRFNKENNITCINDVDQIVFIHFAEMSMKKFASVSHPLYSEYKVYETQLVAFHKGFINKTNKLTFRKIINGIYYLGWKIHAYSAIKSIKR